MKRIPLHITGLSIALCSVLLGCQRPATEATTPASAEPAATAATPAPAPAETTKAPPTDLEQLANRLVTQSAAVKEGEVVLISGRMQDAELMEDLAVNVRKVGAFPLVIYTSDRMAKRMFFDVPDKYDSQVDALDMALVNLADVNIAIANGMTENLFEGADPKRMAARGKAGEGVGQAALKNNVRLVEVGNNLYPTPWRAERYGMAADELANTFWNGINIDYSELQTRGEQVKAALAAGNEIHITNPNGTDLKMSVKGRKVLVSDGIISEADLKAGGPAVSVYLPAGEVYTTPVPGSAEGKVVHTRSFYRGKQIDNLTLTISGGKVTAMTGSGPGYADLKAEYDAVDDARKDMLGFVDLGINPNVKLSTSSSVGTWVPAGTVTVGTGTNTWAGGDNSVAYGATIFLPGSTVTLDGKPIIENGVLKI
ncbi:aminopeptidase [Lysobacter niabensis]|uniref:aminopeptidase n=1 Tax=Agrilutibacter niabensis TaxID=380628 RepID=UPI00360D88E8